MAAQVVKMQAVRQPNSAAEVAWLPSLAQTQVMHSELE